MSLTKVVSGETVLLSAEEESALLAEWAITEVEEVELRRVTDIKAETGKYIVSCLPPSDEPNFLIREMSLVMQNAGLDDIVINGGTLTAEQVVLKAEFRTLKAKIISARALSNLAETNGDTVAQFIIDLDTAGL